MTDKKIRKCVLRLVVCITLILWCGFAACQQAPLEKYQSLIELVQSDEFIESQLDLADEYVKNFCSEEQLAFYMNAAQRAADKQRAFNNQELYSFGTFFSKQVSLYNKDVMRCGFLAADLGIEWLLFYMTAQSLSKSLFTEMMSNRQQYIDLLQRLIAHKTMNDETASILSDLEKLSPYSTTLFVGHVSVAAMRRALLPVCGLAVLTLMSRSMQSSLLLRRPFDVSEWFYGSTSSEPDGLFDLFEKNKFFMLPSDALRGNISGICNDVFRSFNLLPVWTESLYVTWGAEMMYGIFYLHWSARHLFLPAWSSWLFKTAPMLLMLLSAHQKADRNKDEQERLEECLQKYIRRGHTVQPLTWLKHKVINYALWQTAVNCVLALPAWIKIGQTLYPLIKSLFNNEGTLDAA